MLRRLVDGVTKRGMDLALAGAGLAISWPVMLLIAAAIRLEDREGALFVQERVGKDGKPFFLLKFRTMTPRGEGGEGPQVTVGEDPRITKMGHLLRNIRLDELPQLINILRGDMSLVGPRPEVPRYVAHYSEEERGVLAVRPGLTDPATLAYRDEAVRLAKSLDPEATYIEEIMPEKLAMNLEYLSERNTLTDLRVLVRTVGAVLGDRFTDEAP